MVPSRHEDVQTDDNERIYNQGRCELRHSVTRSHDDIMCNKCQGRKLNHRDRYPRGTSTCRHG